MAGAVAQYLQFILLNWFIFTCSGSGMNVSRNKRVHTARTPVHLPENVAGTAKYILAIFAAFEMGRYWRLFSVP